jgi:hypothetical protein
MIEKINIELNFVKFGFDPLVVRKKYWSVHERFYYVTVQGETY